MWSTPLVYSPPKYTPSNAPGSAGRWFSWRKATAMTHRQRHLDLRRNQQHIQFSSLYSTIVDSDDDFVPEEQLPWFRIGNKRKQDASCSQQPKRSKSSEAKPRPQAIAPLPLPVTSVSSSNHPCIKGGPGSSKSTVVLYSDGSVAANIPACDINPQADSTDPTPNSVVPEVSSPDINRRNGVRALSDKARRIRWCCDGCLKCSFLFQIGEGSP